MNSKLYPMLHMCVAVFTYYVFNIIREFSNIPISTIQQQAKYLAYNSVLSTYHTDTFYASKILFHPLSLLLKNNFVVLGYIGIALTAFFISLYIGSVRTEKRLHLYGVISYIIVGGLITLSYYHVGILYLLLLSTLTTVALINKNKMFNWAGYILYTAVAFVDFFSSLLIVIAIIYHSYRTEKNTTISPFYYIMLAISFVMYISQLGALRSVPEYVVAYPWFVELGVANGYNGVLAFIALATSVIAYKSSKKSLYFVAITSIILASLHPLFGFVTMLIVSMHVTQVVISTINDKWAVGFSKNLTIIALICSVLLSFLLFGQSLDEQSPTAEQLSMLEFSYNNIPQGSIVMTSQTTAALFESTLIYGNDQPSFTNNFNTSRFLTFDQSEFIEYVDQTNINYIVIDEQIRKEYLDNQYKGILPILNTSRQFTKIFDANNTQIWTTTR